MVSPLYNSTSNVWGFWFLHIQTCKIWNLKTSLFIHAVSSTEKMKSKPLCTCTVITDLKVKWYQWYSNVYNRYDVWNDSLPSEKSAEHLTAPHCKADSKLLSIVYTSPCDLPPCPPPILCHESQLLSDLYAKASETKSTPWPIKSKITVKQPWHV